MCITPNKYSAGRRLASQGFTLLEVLIALFIFTILSMILVGALHTVMNASSRTEASAERLRNLQIALLVMSRDIEQAVNRPVLTAAGKQQAAFEGDVRGFTFTHTGFANPMGTLTQSSLQRTHYYGDGNSLWRAAWSALDQAPSSQPHARRLLNNVTDIHFQYTDKKGRLHAAWPLEGEADQALPAAIKVTFTMTQWGQMSQVYVISATAKENNPAPPASPTQP